MHIKAVFNEHHGRYSAPRLTRALKASKIKGSRNRIAKRMKILKLKALAKRKFKVTTDSEHSLPVFNNILDSNFNAEAINKKWSGDITYISTKEIWLYLAVVIDLFSRAIIGWSMSIHLNKDLVCDALTMALYCSYQYRKLLNKNNLIGSMSHKGNCWYNAPCESFFTH